MNSLKKTKNSKYLSIYTFVSIHSDTYIYTHINVYEYTCTIYREYILSDTDVYQVPSVRGDRWRIRTLNHIPVTALLGPENRT